MNTIFAKTGFGWENERKMAKAPKRYRLKIVTKPRQRFWEAFMVFMMGRQQSWEGFGNTRKAAKTPGKVSGKMKE